MLPLLSKHMKRATQQPTDWGNVMHVQVCRFHKCMADCAGRTSWLSDFWSTLCLLQYLCFQTLFLLIKQGCANWMNYWVNNVTQGAVSGVRSFTKFYCFIGLRGFIAVSSLGSILRLVIAKIHPNGQICCLLQVWLWPFNSSLLERFIFLGPGPCSGEPMYYKSLCHIFSLWKEKH